MDFSAFLTPMVITAAAFLLLAWSVSATEKKSVAILAALGMIAVTLAVQFFKAAQIIPATIVTLQTLGIGLLIGSVYLFFTKKGARNFFLPGLLALGIAWGLALTNQATDAVVDFFTERTTPHLPNQFLLELGPDDSIQEVADLLYEYNADFERAFPSVSLAEDENLAQYYIVHADERVLEDLMTNLRADTENVDHVSWNVEVSLNPPSDAETAYAQDAQGFWANDPKIDAQWGFAKTQGNELHEFLQNQTPQKKALVAIVDTGVDGGHEDLTAIFRSSPGNRDGHGHGTHCAGLAGAATNNSIGMASYNWEGQFVDVAGYKGLSDSGMGSAEQIAQAIIDATKDGADVISLSLGGWAPIPPKVEVDAINYAFKQGVIVVAAAGNSNEDARQHAPSNIEGVITVSAVDENLNKASFSNTNTGLKRPIAAPGVNMLSLEPNNRYVPKNGTSMATPMVSGLIGVMRALNPNLTAAEAYTILQETGTDVRDSGKVGRVINAEAAVKAAMQ